MSWVILKKKLIIKKIKIMGNTQISWTQKVWNPSTGCTPISEGCKHCYAQKMAHRLKGMGQSKYVNDFELTTHSSSLNEPYSWKKPQLVFVNSMSDLFHEKMPLAFIKKVFEVMNNNPQHNFQVLTKRADILMKYAPMLNWTKNIWLGVTVESDKYFNRVDSLRNTGAHLKFLSCEPLLSSIKDIDLHDIGWVIVGGESGPGARPMQKIWVEEIQKKCKAKGVPFFFKQWGGIHAKKGGCLLNGAEYKNFPVLDE